MERLKVSQVAKELGISPTAVYKKFKTSSELVQNHVHKENGVTFIDKEGFELLKKTMQKPQSEAVSTSSELVQTLQKELDRKQEIIESLLTQQEESRKRTDTILMKLTTDISTLQKALEYKKEEPLLEKVVSVTPTVSQESKPVVAIRPEVIIPVQRSVSPLESISSLFDDVLGFAFGRG